MHRFYMFYLPLIILFGTATEAPADSLSRAYVPVVILGKQLPPIDWPTDSMGLFAYAEFEQEWRALPWQVDDIAIENGVRKYNKTESQNNRIDAEDELVVMPQDLGDRAPTWHWPAATDTTQPRIEIALHDPLDNRKAWCYLFAFSGDSHHPKTDGYLVHSPGPSSRPAAHRWETPNYTLGLSANGWPEHLALSLEPERDILDRLKIRLAGEPTILYGIGPYSFDEDTLKWKKSAVVVKPVRAFQDQETLMANPTQFLSPQLNIDYKVHYFPYSFRLVVQEGQLESPQMLALAGVKTLRQSLDFNAEVAGARFYSDCNTDQAITVDGQPDSIDQTLDQTVGEPVWMMISGDFGSVVSIYSLPSVNPPESARLYYADRSDGGTSDGTTDSGDLVSYGDVGLLFQAQQANQVLFSDRITFDFVSYFVPEANQGAELAQKLVAWENTAPAVSADKQSKTAATSVAFEPTTPGNFTLDPAYPNPFDPGRSPLTAHISGGTGTFEAVIYDVLGRRIHRFARSRLDGATTLSWNGTDEFGQTVPSGVYWLRVSLGHRSGVQKILVLPPN